MAPRGALVKSPSERLEARLGSPLTPARRPARQIADGRATHTAKIARPIVVASRRPRPW
jgi:hypothetical protein